MPTPNVVKLIEIPKPELNERCVWLVTRRHVGQGDLSGPDNIVCACGQILMISVTAEDYRKLAFKCAQWGEFRGCGKYLAMPA